MIDVAVLRPSQIEDLAERAWSQAEKVDVLDGISDMLGKTPSDGGADSDRISMAATYLTLAGAWRVISATELADTVKAFSREAQNDFLDGLSSDFAHQVIRHLNA
jgi:hypothetical protein